MIENTAIVDEKKGKLIKAPPARMALMWIILIFLAWALISGQTIRFYASALFLFYALFHSTWISVIFMGVFQTLLLIPLRIINLYKSNNIHEFVKTVEDAKAEEEQRFLVQKSVKTGRQVALFYIVNFCLLAVSFLSLGRLYLTDFYTKLINPDMLYRFVPYPTYPLQGRIFSIPYVWFTDTADFGWRGVFWLWGIIIVGQLTIYLIKDLVKSTKQPKVTDSNIKNAFGAISRYTTGYTLLMMLMAFILARNFPIEWQLFYFKGDVAYPNPTLNLITALVAFFTLIWLNVGKIKKKAELAAEAGMAPELIDRTQTEMFKDTVKVSALVAAGAFFITNQIPCAFELSIFTLELIALLSPWTLDRIILRGMKKPKIELAPDLSVTAPKEKSLAAEEGEVVEAKPAEIMSEGKFEEQSKAPELQMEVASEEKPPLAGEIKF